MPSHDLHHNIKLTRTLAPQTLTGNGTATNGAVVDHQGFESIEHVVEVGVTGDTLSGTVYFTAILQHGDEADGSDMAAVTSTEPAVENGYTLGAVEANGVFARVDSADDDDRYYRIGYRGPKRYSRVVIQRTGNNATGTPVSMFAIQGHPANAPTIDD